MNRARADLTYALGAIDYDYELYPLLDDSRFFLNYPMDMIKKPKTIISQTNETKTVTAFKGFYENSMIKINMNLENTYAHVEKFFLSDKEKIDWRMFDKSGFIMTLHGLPDRVKFIKD